MPDTAYAFFFLAVVLGSAFTLFVSLRRDWRHVAAALRRELPEQGEVFEAPGEVRVRERSQPILRPVTISICRI